MTRLYRLDADAADIAERFGAKSGADPWAGDYVAPEKFAPIVTAGRDFIAGPRPVGRPLKPRMVPRLWAVLPPPNSDDPTRRIVSLRNAESPFWIGHLRNSEFRCVIPATAVMLWGGGTDYEGRRNKHWFGVEGEPVFAMLGVWKDEEVPAFAVLSGDPKGAPSRLGASAAPLILPATQRSLDAWLHGGWDEALHVMDEARASCRLVEMADGQNV